MTRDGARPRPRGRPLRPVARALLPSGRRRQDDEDQFKPEHTFDTKALGYEYDVLHRRRSRIAADAVLALFKQVDIATLPTSYQTYIYVYKEGDAAEPPVGPDAETRLAHPNLAAIGSIFAGKGADCANCQARAAATTTTAATSTTTSASSLTTSTPPTGRRPDRRARRDHREDE